MCPSREPAQQLASVANIARLAEHIAIQHDDRVSPDNNTLWDFSASGMRLAPGQQSRVAGEGQRRRGQRSGDGRRGSAVALLTVGANGAKGNAEEAEQLTAARRSGGEDQRGRRSVHYNPSAYI